MRIWEVVVRRVSESHSTKDRKVMEGEEVSISPLANNPACQNPKLVTWSLLIYLPQTLCIVHFRE